jgi:hypothetical protein
MSTPPSKHYEIIINLMGNHWATKLINANSSLEACNMIEEIFTDQRLAPPNFKYSGFEFSAKEIGA